jgi:iron complex transport system substrate-binding protein
MINRFTFLFALALLCGCGKPTRPVTSGPPPERIISLAPSVTETLYALGLEDKLIATSTYCRYPEAAQKLPKIGDYGNYNFEAILSMKPDLVILLTEFDAEKYRLDGLGIPYLETGTYFISDIMETIKNIGATCGAKAAAEKLIAQLNSRMDSVQNKDRSRPRTLMVFNRQPSSGDVEQIHAFGTECLHNELLELAGGQNVMEGKLPFAILSREAILRLNPDVIIELTAADTAPDDPSEPWKKLSSVNAVRNNRITVITGNRTFIPGPRFIDTLEDLTQALWRNE